jgi:hypothetical protein
LTEPSSSRLHKTTIASKFKDLLSDDAPEARNDTFGNKTWVFFKRFLVTGVVLAMTSATLYATHAVVVETFFSSVVWKQLAAAFVVTASNFFLPAIFSWLGARFEARKPADAMKWHVGRSYLLRMGGLYVIVARVLITTAQEDSVGSQVRFLCALLMFPFSSNVVEKVLGDGPWPPNLPAFNSWHIGSSDWHAFVR